MKQNNLIVFIFGIIFAQRILIVGQIHIGEIIAVIYVFFRFFDLRFTDFEKKLMFFTFFITLLQGFSDLYNNTSLDKSLKGFFTYIVFTASIIFLSRYLKSDKNFNRAIFFFIGALVAKIQPHLFFNIYFWGNPWKWGIGYFTINLVLITALFYKKDFSKLFFIIFSVAIIYFSLLNNARSLLFVYGSSLITYLLFYNSQKINLKFFNKKYSFMLLPLSYVLFAVILGIVVVKFYPVKTFVSNFAAMDQKNTREGLGEFGVVASSRSALVSAFYAIKDRPIIGHGSYPEDKNMKYITKQFEFLYKFGYARYVPNTEQMSLIYGRAIPAHSYIFNSMVTAGILGGAFWIFLTYFIAKNYANYSNYLPFIFHFWIIFYFYALFFSPWGATGRINLEINLSLLILYIASMESNKSRQQNKKIN